MSWKDGVSCKQDQLCLLFPAQKSLCFPVPAGSSAVLMGSIAGTTGMVQGSVWGTASGMVPV